MQYAVLHPRSHSSGEPESSQIPRRLTNALAIESLGDTTKAGHPTESLPTKHRKRTATKRKTPAEARRGVCSIGHVPSEEFLPGSPDLWGLKR
jgi:hypothetical protein